METNSQYSIVNIQSKLSRRSLLKQGLVATAGVVAVPALAQATPSLIQQDIRDLNTYDFLIARVRFAMDTRTGDRWNIVPAGEKNLLRALGEIIRCRTKPVPVRNKNQTYAREGDLNAVVSFDESKRINRFPFLLMTGDGAFVFNASQKQALRHYIEQGGFILMDDCVFHGGGDFFFRSAFELLNEVFGKPTLRTIPRTHEIFHNVYDMGDIGLPFVQGQKHEPWGVFQGERLAVLLSCGDLHCGWADRDYGWYGRHGRGPGCHGHDETIRMGINIAMYAMTH